ncbi:MAG: DDE-type integrase/transposase/recombinase [Methylophaga sp.]|nr:DDE-type integrase/transposase/recombinase [Methylophaga sp.]
MSASTNVVPLTPQMQFAVAMNDSDSLWSKLTDKKRQKATDIATLIKPAIDYQQATNQHHIRPLAEYLHFHLSQKRLPEKLLKLAKLLAQKDKALPSQTTLRRWIERYMEQGLMGLVPQQKGSVPKPLGCEVRIRHLMRSGSKNNPGNITKMLQQEGHDVEYHQIRRRVIAMPAIEGTHNSGRLGALAFDSMMKPYTRRKTGHMPVGSCYQADGNMMPIYLQHPTGNRPARFEITPIIDVVSRYIVGYYISESESAISTVMALTDAIIKENHVPIDLQADNGPGFSNSLVTRYYEKLGITEVHPRARNPKDNGYVERFNLILKEELLKQFPAYCGKDAAPEPLQLYLKKVDKGEKQLMSVEQFKVFLDEYIHWYNHKRKHGSIGNKTPAQLWANVERNPPIDVQDVFFWDQAERVVQRSAISFESREYYSPELIQYNTEKVIVEFNINDDSFVKIRDLDERWLCDAQKINAAPYRSISILEDRKQKSLIQKRKRLQIKMDEVEDRNALNITHENWLDGAMLLDPTPSLQQKTASEDAVLNANGDQTESEINIDIFDTDY